MLMHVRGRDVSETWECQRGQPKTKFYARSNGDLIAVGYERICYGDHGCYVEFKSEQVQIANLIRLRKKSRSAYYDELFSSDRTVMLYLQQRDVSNQPNPPTSGRYFAFHNRKEGYADYITGMYYVDVDNLTTVPPTLWLDDV